MNRSLLRSGVLLPFLLAAIGCGGFNGESGQGGAGAGDGTSANANGGPVGGDDTTGPDGGKPGTVGTAPTLIDVHGTVTSYADVPIIGRTLRVLDANGSHVDVVTDAKGAFTVPGVAAPYDIRVSAEGLTDAATVYLGLHDPSPYVHASLAGSSPAAAVTQRFNVGFLLAGPCASCVAIVVTKSTHGYGSASMNFPVNGDLVSFPVDHNFVSDGSPSEAVTMDILVHDVPATWYRYQQASQTAIAGRTSPGGLYAPPLVPVHPLSTTIAAPGVPANWRSQLAVGMELPGGSAFNLDSRGASSIVTNVPVIPGATLTARAWLIDPVTDVDTTIANDVQARSGAQPGGTTSITLSASPPLHDVVPAPHATLSLKAPGISWTAPPSTVTEVQLYDGAKHRALVSVFTDGNAVGWAKLAALGIIVGAGELTLNLVTTPHADLAHVVAADPATRTVHDYATAGDNAYLRWGFTLTP